MNSYIIMYFLYNYLFPVQLFVTQALRFWMLKQFIHFKFIKTITFFFFFFVLSSLKQ